MLLTSNVFESFEIYMKRNECQVVISVYPDAWVLYVTLFPVVKDMSVHVNVEFINSCLYDSTIHNYPIGDCKPHMAEP